MSAPCILWEGCVSSSGYGTSSYKGKVTSAHRAAYMRTKGPIPEGRVIRHTCGKKLCVNPDHLIHGTQKENMNDANSPKRRGKSSLYKPRGMTVDKVLGWLPSIVIVENDCWIYPTTKYKNLYPTIRFGKRMYYVHRLVVCLTEGISYDVNFMARHRCHNKHCVAPHHLHAGTRSDNTKDSILTHPMTKLNWHIVDQIRSCRDAIKLLPEPGKFDMILGKYFEVSVQSVSNIRRNKSWNRGNGH